jgi:hypothetical protein
MILQSERCCEDVEEHVVFCIGYRLGRDGKGSEGRNREGKGRKGNGGRSL